MPRNRTPKAVAEVTGQTRNHPRRFAGRQEPQVPPLGEPPARLSAEHKAVWRQFAADMPWLGRPDRALVELTTRLVVKCEQPDASLAFRSELRRCLSAMGGTPVDRSRVKAPEEREPDPADEYLN